MEKDLQAQVDELKVQVNALIDLYNKDNNPSSEIFKKKAIFMGGTSFNNSSLGSAGDIMSVYGEPPVAQAVAINAPSTPGVAYVQAEAQSAVTAINSIRNALKNFGITE
jgi:hypothetical protein